MCRKKEKSGNWRHEEPRTDSAQNRSLVKEAFGTWCAKLKQASQIAIGRELSLPS